MINGFARLEQSPGEAVLRALAAECGRRGFDDFTSQVGRGVGAVPGS